VKNFRRAARPVPSQPPVPHALMSLANPNPTLSCSSTAAWPRAQAWGNILNLSVLLFFLAVLGQTAAPYDPRMLSLTWRLQYGLGLLPIAFMLYYRVFRLEESAMWKVRRRARSPVRVGF